MEIQNYSDYLIYPNGTVFSKKRKGIFLKPRADGVGYHQVGLSKNGKEVKYLVHRLVGIHYIPNPENKKEVDHINRDKTDNRIENLRWVNRSENQQNTGMNSNNKSGHKNISYYKQNDTWRYGKMINKKRIQKAFKSKIDCICYKFIIEYLIKYKDFYK